MIKRFLHKYWEIFVIIFLSLTPFTWLHGGQIVLGHDSGFRLNPLRGLEDVWYSWNSAVNFGVATGVNKGFLLTQLPEALLVRLTGSLPVGQMLSFILWFFLIGISMFSLVKNFFPGSRYWFIRLFASSYYMYNFFLLQGWFMTERAKFSMFAALPILFVIFWNTMNRKYSFLKGGLLFGLTTLLLNGGGSPPLYGGILVSLSVATVFFIFQSIWQRNIRDVFIILLRILFLIVVSALFNFYWIIPQVFEALQKYGSAVTQSGGIEGILDWEASVSKYASLINLFRLQGIPDWYENSFHPYSSLYITSPLLIIVSFFPIMAIIYVLIRKDLWVKFEPQRRFLHIIFSLFMISLIFTKGTHAPLGFIYVFFMRYVPGFAIFRTSFYKFGPATWLSIIILSAISFSILLNHYIKNRVIRIFVEIVLISGIVVYHFPYFGGNFFLWNRPFTTRVVLPTHIQEMFSYMTSTDDNHVPRTLLLPPLDSNFHADSYTWGFWSLDMLARLGIHIPIVANDSNLPIVSALYDAAIDNNVTIFSRLANRLSIQKVLWRGDILYSDKLTTSKNFSSIPDQLLRAPNIGKEKISGDWILYNVGTKSSDLIRTESRVYRVDTDESALRPLFYTFDTGGISLAWAGSFHGPELEQELGPFLQGNIYAAKCEFCDPSELERIENMSTIPYVRFLPDSLIYPLVKLKEQKTIKSFQEMPQQRIDADLGFATKRLVEISGIINRNTKDNSNDLAMETSVRFRGFIDDAVRETKDLPEVERNDYKAKVATYMKFYMKYLAKLDEKDTLPKVFFEALYDYLQGKNSEISKELWITETIGSSKYYISIPTEGMYQVLVSGSQGVPKSVVIDGVEITDLNTVPFTEGTHKLVLNFESKNLLSTVGSMSAYAANQTKNQYVFPIQNISHRNVYQLEFNYRLTEGNSLYVSIHQDNDPQDAMGNTKRVLLKRMVDDGAWHHMSYVIHPNFGAVSGDVVLFSSHPFELQNVVDISNIVFRNIQPADVFAIRKNNITANSDPTIFWKKINQSFYELSVQDAHTPYILRFDQAYDSGWKAFVLPLSESNTIQHDWQLFRLFFRKPIGAIEHFTIDDYANAWYMDTKGTYTVLLVYWPYVIFLGSIIVSVISIVLCLLLACVIRMKRKNIYDETH